MAYSPSSQEEKQNQQFSFQSVFESQAGLVLVVSPQLIILGATDAYLRETLTHREQVIGKYLFNVFPDNPEVPEGESKSIKASIEKVLSTGKQHQAGTLQYDIPDPDNPGQFLQRFWSTTNTPVLDQDGKVTCVVHETVNITDSVKAQALLEESRRREQEALADAQQQRLRLERLFEQAPAACAILEGPDFVYKVLNSAYQQLFPGRQMMGLSLFEALPELRNQIVYDIIQNVYQTGETFEGKEILIPVARYEGKPVEDIYWNFIYQALFDAQGKVNGILIFALDVTDFVEARRQVENTAEALQNLNQELEQRVERRTKELQLAEAEAEWQSKRLTDLFMRAPAAICILDGPELVYELVNPGYAMLFPGRVLLGKPILEALPEIKNNPVYKTFRQVYETGQTHEETEMFIPIARPGDGVLEDRYFRYIQQARHNEEGIVDGVIVFALEVTEQVEARKAVEASANQLRLVTDSLPVLIGYLDKERKYRFTNKAYEKWFPIKASDLIGRYVKDVVGQQAYDNTSAYMDRALSGERVDFEASMPYREDFKKHIQTTYVPDVQNGEVKGFYTLVTDITDQVEARKAVEKSEQKALALAEELAAINLELQTANKELGATNQRLTYTNIDLDNFIYTASHDLRAPIYNIERLLEELLLELSAEDYQQSEVKYITSMMQEAVNRFKRTISSLTEITKLQKDENQETTSVNLSELVREVVLDLENNIRESGAQLKVSMDEATSVSFSRKNLRSIIYNLLANAIKYHHPERTPIVKLASHQEEEYLVLTIEDNGLGMSVKNQGKLYTMFRRFHDHVDGSGIGLYMVKRIVDNVGGRIEVESEEGIGTIFRVYLKANSL
ncbi:PAS domain-containing sensor histidine kinase [Pontibacter roseus]|uniref:PAS domain-containing sensor histidine kinase n=1 Tax=Pontibacter roseus TaxID=336989 RepID=UPI00036DAB57|nr:PAS domain-containing protein [Pontibacter roseus]